MSGLRQPCFYISHGGGPCFWVDLPPPFGAGAFDKLRDHLAGLVAGLPETPKAFLVISAHWEEGQATVSVNPKPGMLFDYYGFPEDTYKLNYPAPGSPELAERVMDLLGEAGIAAAANGERGFDHGVFVPFLIIDAAARIPVVTLSLRQDLDPAFHIALGKALAPLRDEGVVIVGSGSSFHNLRSYFDGDGAKAAAFDQWLVEAVTQKEAAARNRMLVEWEKAPFARACHPREEHLLPLMVAAGAGGDEVGLRSFGDVIGGKAVSCFTFGR